MEPRRDDGDDTTHLVGARGDPEAAMEPRRDDGDDRLAHGCGAGDWITPQWSPVVTTGTTRPLGDEQTEPRMGRNGAPS